MLKFSQSVGLAIEFMLKQVLGGRPGGWPEPAWRNFAWFSKIDPGRISPICEVPPTAERNGYRVLQRDVTFYLAKDKVAVLTLEGRRYSEGQQSATVWAIRHVRYAMHWNTGFDQNEWVEKRLTGCFVGLVGFLSED